jgi:hypothetical protein
MARTSHGTVSQFHQLRSLAIRWPKGMPVMVESDQAAIIRSTIMKSVRLTHLHLERRFLTSHDQWAQLFTALPQLTSLFLRGPIVSQLDFLHFDRRRRLLRLELSAKGLHRMGPRLLDRSAPQLTSLILRPCAFDGWSLASLLHEFRSPHLLRHLRRLSIEGGGRRMSTIAEDTTREVETFEFDIDGGKNIH